MESPICKKLRFLETEEIRNNRVRIDQISVDIQKIQAAIKSEDSKAKCAALAKEIDSLIEERNKCINNINTVTDEKFKDLLAIDYKIERNHPKFDVLYHLSHQWGHNEGYCGIEAHFAQMIHLVK